MKITHLNFIIYSQNNFFYSFLISFFLLQNDQDKNQNFATKIDCNLLY